MSVEPARNDGAGVAVPLAEDMARLQIGSSAQQDITANGQGQAQNVSRDTIVVSSASNESNILGPAARSLQCSTPFLRPLHHHQNPADTATFPATTGSGGSPQPSQPPYIGAASTFRDGSNSKGDGRQILGPAFQHPHSLKTAASLRSRRPTEKGFPISPHRPFGPSSDTGTDDGDMGNCKRPVKVSKSRRAGSSISASNRTAHVSPEAPFRLSGHNGSKAPVNPDDDSDKKVVSGSDGDKGIVSDDDNDKGIDISPEPDKLMISKGKREPDPAFNDDVWHRFQQSKNHNPDELWTDRGKAEYQRQLKLGGFEEGSLALKLLFKRDWILNALKHRYRVYIQQIDPDIILPARMRKGKDRAEYGIACDHPSCDHEFEDADYRVSFEPLVWTQPMESSMSGLRSQDAPVELTLDRDFMPQDNPDVRVAIPDYERVSQAVNTKKYGEGQVFCLHCFEDLIVIDSENQKIAIPKDGAKGQGARSQGGRKWLRPSPSRYIYSWIFPETRYDERAMLALDPKEAKIILAWKKMLLKEDATKMSELYKWLKGGEPESEPGAYDDLSFLKLPGLGIGECLWLWENPTTEMKMTNKVATSWQCLSEIGVHHAEVGGSWGFANSWY